MKKKVFFKLLSFLFLISGFGILFSVFFPIFSYEITSKPLFESFLSPIPYEEINSRQTDFTKASNWFVGGANKDEFVSPTISFYTLSIPRLNIENVTVKIGGEDLSESLIHYPGTAVPGKRGNAVVFGHSILPYFFDPKNYISMFSTLPTLKIGNEIDISYDGVYYTFRVIDMLEVLPTDIQVLEQDTSDSFLTLVTCVPPGDPRRLKRLIVRAKVVPPSVANEIVGN